MADKRHYRDTDYLYASAYIRSVEDRGLSDQLIARMLDAPDAEGAVSALFEAKTALEGGGEDIREADALCDEFVNDSFRVVSEATVDPSVFDFLRYQYDCNNIKTTLKCRAKSVSAEGLLFRCGTVPPEAYAKMAETDDFSALPGDFAAAAREAADAYKRTGDPQTIDLCLDLACLSSMMKSAEATGDALLTGAVRLRVDIANVLAVIRVLRLGDGMDGTARRELLKRALSPLGSVKPDELIRAAAGTDEDGGKDEDNGSAEKFFSLVRSTMPGVLDAALTPDSALSVIERSTEEAYLSYVLEGGRAVFGVGVPFAYLTSREYNAKNARIIIAGKRAGLPYDEISQRVRRARR